VARMWEKQNLYTLLLAIPEEISSLRRPARRWSIKMDFKISSLSDSGERKVAGPCEHGNVLSGFITRGDFPTS